MVINRGEMKRKRREDCSSPLLDESPKRTKVHAQRKFAQGSNVNSPVITPVKEIEKQEIDVLPEPVELLPIKRPNTDDFLTFLCFRGTPILPPSLNFFNTASIVDTNGQVHEIKSESPKNGPIDTSTITKSGSGSAERPFIAFGVRKRADPIVISRQMDKKRRHALALQALRRKYQEQRMAKIRAVTISKLSEKVSNKTLVRSNSISKNETVNKKGNTIQKNKAVETATKHVKVVTRSAKTTLRPQIKQKMCLRSFRGRFVQKELQFRNVKKRPLPVKKVIKSVKKKEAENVKDSEYSSEDEKPLSKTSLETKRTCKVVLPKVAKKMAPGPKKPMEINFRITRSNKFLNNKIVSRRQQIKQRMLMSTPKTTVKPRTLRSHTAQKTKIISETTQKVIVKAKKVGKDIIKKDSTPVVKKLVKSSEQPKNEQKEPVKKYEKDMRSVRKDEKDLKPIKKDEKDLKLLKKDEKVLKPLKKDEKEIKSVKKDEKEMKSVKKFEKDIKCVKKDEKDLKSESSRVPVKSTDAMKKDFSPISSNKNKVEKVPNVKNIDITKKAKLTSKQTVQTVSKKPEPTIEKKDLNKKKVPVAKKEPPKKNENSSKKDFGTSKKEPLEEVNKKTVVVKSTERKENIEFRTSQRPTRKTKEAAAIYMEILSHKLVNESRMDDDNVSIDSFPELPNVKRTEQRENELKAKARSTKTSESETDTKKHPKIESDTKKTPKIKEKEVEVVESKSLRSNDKKLEVRNEEEKKVLEEPKAESVKIEVVKEEVLVCDRKTRSANQEKTVASPLDKIKEVELKVHINPIELNSENKNVVAVKRKKEKLQEDETETDISDNNLKSKKCEKTIKPDVEGTKRQTRNSSQNIRHADSDDSDESFRADIRIPRKKQLTRSKVLQTNESEDDSKSLKKPLNTKSYKECDSSSSDSDQSTTSDINVKPVKVTKNKKFTKTRSQQKSDQGFSDSDEEPLSKLTQSIKTIDTKDTIKEEICSEKKSKVQQPDPKTNKTKDTKEKTVEINEKEAKPKRECAKRPQYYLPMFSSSDEEDNYFQGFTSKPEKPKISKSPENGCSHNKTTLDLSCKDIGRRFGKGKVNMSTEQIEKWLKDSAMAGSSVKNENDEMLKFGEKIPTETSHSVATSIDTEKLKTLLITNIEKIEGDVEKKDVPKSAPSDSVNKLGRVVKPNVTDRKLIFRNKDKAGGAPRVQAFSASNESSVYAFGEDEDVMKTPFRRPTRRPSSTATSKSEDESSKFEEFSKTASTSGQFRKPPLLKQDSSKSLKESLPNDETSEDTVLAASSEDNAFNAPTQPHKPLIVTNKPKSVLSVQKKHLSMVPPTSASPKLTPKHSLKQPPKLFDRSSDASEDLKYKVPSSPSASSSSSAKLYKRQASNKPKLRATEIFPVKLPDFPIGGNSALLVEAPTFHPTDKEFQDPLEYIEKIRAKAEQFGICRIVPPSNFKPECKVTDDMRFTAYNQYVHKMLHRWGPNFKELMAIKKYLSTQNINLTHPPWIGGMEIDLPRLYQTVQTLGGLKEVIEKKKWPKVSDLMKIPKSAQDRVTKLDDIYCKYLLPYDTLSPAEREKLFDEVETEWAKRESKSLLKAQQNIDDNTMEVESESDDEAEECIVKGRSMALNAFYRIARNTMSMWFKNSEPPAEEVEQEFWKHVTLKQNHICVHSGSIDSGNWGYGFAVSKNSPFARHAWNLKVLTNNSGSILRSMGPVMGVTVPTLHVGMVFSSCCWYRDPHSLPWIEYLHTGGNKIWYGIPDSTSGAFHSALKTLVPNYCRNKSLWLPSDTVMVPPNLLVENGVSLCRIVQEPGQFIVVFPKVFTSSLSTGYVVSESVYFAPPYWLKTGRSFFNEMRNSCEPPMFSFDKLLLSIVNDARSNVEVLKLVIPAVQELCDKEKSAREKVKGLGVTETERLPLPEAPKVRKKKMQNEDGEYECEICRMNLFVSMVTESQEDAVYCLDHAVEQIEKKKVQSKHCTLTFTYDDEELDGLVEKIKLAITCKMQKKVPNKFTGLPTLLTK